MKIKLWEGGNIVESDYKKYRGKCYEYAVALVMDYPDLIWRGAELKNNRIE